MKISRSFGFLATGLTATCIASTPVSKALRVSRALALDDCYGQFRTQRLVERDEYVNYVLSEAAISIITNAESKNLDVTKMKEAILNGDGGLTDDYASHLPAFIVLPDTTMAPFVRFSCRYNNGGDTIEKYCKTGSPPPVKDLPSRAGIRLSDIDSRDRKKEVVTEICSAASTNFDEIVNILADYYIGSGLLSNLGPTPAPTPAPTDTPTGAPTTAPTAMPTKTPPRLDRCKRQFEDQRFIERHEYTDFILLKAAEDIIDRAAERELDVSELQPKILQAAGDVQTDYASHLPNYNVLPSEVTDKFVNTMCKYRVSGDGTWQLCNSNPRLVTAIPEGGGLRLGDVSSDSTKEAIVEDLCAIAQENFVKTIDSSIAFYLGQGTIKSTRTAPPTMAPTRNPTVSPTANPTESPTMSPTKAPVTPDPTMSPTIPTESMQNTAVPLPPFALVLRLDSANVDKEQLIAAVRDSLSQAFASANTNEERFDSVFLTVNIEKQERRMRRNLAQTALVASFDGIAYFAHMPEATLPAEDELTGLMEKAIYDEQFQFEDYLEASNDKALASVSEVSFFVREPEQESQPESQPGEPILVKDDAGEPDKIPTLNLVTGIIAACASVVLLLAAIVFCYQNWKKQKNASKEGKELEAAEADPSAAKDRAMYVSSPKVNQDDTTDSDGAPTVDNEDILPPQSDDGSSVHYSVSAFDADDASLSRFIDVRSAARSSNHLIGDISLHSSIEKDSMTNPDFSDGGSDLPSISTIKGEGHVDYPDHLLADDDKEPEDELPVRGPSEYADDEMFDFVNNSVKMFKDKQKQEKRATKVVFDYGG